jgi:hypothetical protein
MDFNARIDAGCEAVCPAATRGRNNDAPAAAAPILRTSRREIIASPETTRYARLLLLTH